MSDDVSQIDTKVRALRRTVNAIALSLVAAITILAPLGYGLIDYRYEETHASFRAKLSASRVAQYIYQHSQLWQYQTARIAELIRLTELPDNAGRYRVIDQAGKVVLSEDAVAAYATMTRTVPISVAGVSIGRVEFTVPLDSMIQRLGIATLLSLLLALCAYATIRIFPFRVLDRALEGLDSAHRMIVDKNAALEQQNHELMEREQALRSTKAMLRQRSEQLLEAQHLGKIGDWSFRLGDKTLWWSPEIYQLLAYDPQSFRPERNAVTALYVGDSARRLQQAQAEVMRTGLVNSVDIKVKRGDGSIGDLAITSKAMINADGGIIGLSGTIQDISARKSAEAQLEKLAYYDPLTGLANRSLFHLEISELMVRNRRTGSDAALLLLDLDGFKEINDTLGHGAGDELLRKIGQLISQALGPGNFLSRLGGDEFAIVLSHPTPRSEIEQLATTLLAAIAGPIALERGEAAISTSIGIAMIPRDGSTLNEILRSADLALYRAKEDGRGRYRFFEAGMSAAVQHKMALSRDLRAAITDNVGLSVHYQPQIELSSDRVAGFEALMRWSHPTLGSISPAEFIPLAESSHLICDLGLWILREAATQAKRWLDAGEPPRDIAVNVSAAQIWHTDFVSDVVRVLEDTGLPPHLLCLELTESLLADHAEGRVRNVLMQLKRLGVTLALDDFGTGYSSLGYLTQLPFDKLKIDRVFIDGIAGSERSRKLLQGVIALGRGLGMTLVMEGVERAEEVDILLEFDCDVVQGFFFARPTVAATALDFARAFDGKVERRAGAGFETAARAAVG
ncbi:putative bifunctional diguanylate cyclase/phosphodiesterase [Rhodopseudomonas palustris]|uniref:Diguanylate cyclase/phosphodiesterase n=1 Tax=Rhodopseudomonas palustris (strain BisB18) TaxID=316056 RepID=Q217Z3_RHOPB